MQARLWKTLSLSGGFLQEGEALFSDAEAGRRQVLWLVGEPVGGMRLWRTGTDVLPRWISIGDPRLLEVQFTEITVRIHKRDWYRQCKFLKELRLEPRGGMGANFIGKGVFFLLSFFPISDSEKKDNHELNVKS